MKKTHKEHILLLAGILIITWLGLIFMITTGFFILNQSLSIASISLSSVCTIFAGLFLAKKVFSLTTIHAVIGLLLWILPVAAFTWISGMVYDNTWDGQDYHQKAIIQITDGFNPIYDFAEPDEYYNRALNFYPKAPWIISANIYLVTKNIETAKAVSALLLLAGFYLLTAILLEINNLQPWFSAFSAVLIICNPVAMAQILTFYIDGLVGTILTMFILTVYIYLYKNRKIGFYLILFTLILGLNIKFTGTAYLLIFSLFSIGFQWAIEKRRISIPSISLPILIGSLVGILVFGISPYVLNTIKYQNPFYPIYGGVNEINRTFVMEGQYPVDFEHLGKLEAFARSLFSKTSNDFRNKGSELKIPFTISFEEVKSFRSPDVRVAGFGPFFGGGLLIVTFIIIRGCQTRKPFPIWMILLALGGILFSVFVNEENWWARYVPQLWLIPCLGILIVLKTRDMLLTISRVLICLVLAINLFVVVGANSYFNYKMTRSINTVLLDMSQSKDLYFFYLGPFSTWTLKLDRYHVNYSIVSSLEKLECPETVQYIAYSKAVCP